jgi:hypothetical protein
MASSAEVMAADFANKVVPAGGDGSVHFAGGTFYSYSEPIAKILTERKAWVTTTRFSATTTKHRTAVFRALVIAGYEVEEGPVCPAVPADYVANAPVPALSKADAKVVATALRERSLACDHAAPRQSCPLQRKALFTEAARCRALSDVFDAAAEGDGASALGIHAAMVALGEGL